MREKMEYAAFADAVEKRLAEVIPMLGCPCVLERSQKVHADTGTINERLTIRRMDLDVGVSLNLTDHYTDALEDGFEFTMDEIVKRFLVRWQEMDNYYDAFMRLQQISSYEEMKPNLRLVLRSMDFCYRKHVEAVARPYLGMMSMVVYQHADVIAYIPRTWLQEYGVDENTIFEDAIKMSVKNYPMTIKSMMDCCMEIFSSVEENEELLQMHPDTIPDSPLMVVSDITKCNGASVILYPGVLEKIAAKLGNFYLLPSSAHEVLVVRACDLPGEPGELRQLVAEVNANEVSPDERLVDCAYYYDQESKTLSPIA